MPPPKSSLATALLLLFGVSVSVAIADAVGRWLVPDRYFVYPPGFRQVFEPLPELIPGVFGSSLFTTNALGIRGDPFSPQQRHRFLAVGGSTTICIYLDDSEAWPHLVQDQLDAALGRGHTWVGNVGRSGHTTVQNAIQVEKLLRQHPEIDAVILLAGVNDLLIHLALAIDPSSAARILARGDDRTALLESAFSGFPASGAGAPWYRRTGIGRLWTLRRFALPWEELVAPRLDAHGLRLLDWRSARKQARVLREALPDLSAALDHYARNLERILDVAAAEGVRVILLTQPSLWREDLSAEERDLLWTGGPPLDRVAPGAEYYSVGALAEGMRLYNTRLLRVCRERGAECFDLAARMPRSAEFFWDDVHFTEAGSRRVADLLAAHLLERQPMPTRHGGRGGSAPTGRRESAADREPGR
jgi:lysophospholipase L1-like esterase